MGPFDNIYTVPNFIRLSVLEKYFFNVSLKILRKVSFFSLETFTSKAFSSWSQLLFMFFPPQLVQMKLWWQNLNDVALLINRSGSDHLDFVTSFLTWWHWKHFYVWQCCPKTTCGQLGLTQIPRSVGFRRLYSSSHLDVSGHYISNSI